MEMLPELPTSAHDAQSDKTGLSQCPLKKNLGLGDNSAAC